MTRTVSRALAARVALTLMIPAAAWSAPRSIAPQGFAFEQRVMVPGKPEVIYDAFTGDVSGWWDHTFSESPKALVIEPRVGGGFIERFDDRDNGVRHADVTWAQRGKRLRLVGPLGFAGAAVLLVSTLDFEAVGDSTQIKLTCQGTGNLEPGWSVACEHVWNHFLVERFKPHVESGRHLKHKR